MVGSQGRLGLGSVNPVELGRATATPGRRAESDKGLAAREGPQDSASTRRNPKTMLERIAKGSRPSRTAAIAPRHFVGERGHVESPATKLEVQ